MYNKNIEPKADSIFIKPLSLDEYTKVGITILDTVEDRSRRYKVITNNKVSKEIKMMVKGGDSIMYGECIDASFPFNWIDHLFINISDIYTTIKSY
jgi:co-chaperonin GroES (HSP10)